MNGVSYTVVSSATYANDAGAVTTSCSSTAKTQANLKITSTVSSPLTRGNVDISGLVTAPAGTGFGSGEGRIIVKVVDRDQEPIQGVAVALAGSTNFSEDTNAAGCAVFAFVPSGNYTATIRGAGPRRLGRRDAAHQGRDLHGRADDHLRRRTSWTSR